MVKLHKLKYTILEITTILFLTNLFSHFEDIPVGARIAGLNNCATAVGDDIFTSYFNPAGLENIKSIEIGMDYNKLHLGLTDGSNISSGLVLISKRFSGIGGFLFGYRQVGLVGYYTERKFSLGFGRKITVLATEINLGGKLNIFSKSFNKTMYTQNAVNLITGETKNGPDPVFAFGYSKIAAGLDFGLIYKFLDNHHLGLLFENINEPDIGLKNVDVISRNIKIGYMFRYFNVKAISDLSLYKDGVVFALSGEREISILLTDKLLLRGGLGFGSKGYSNLSFGASFVYKEMFQFDYGFNYLLRGVANLSGSHQVSLIVKFK
ncbi:MAG: hypothetical protein NZ839_02935 [Endomicrobia bacterium]|nr:hypothetical protein [Endomicrobiia bacterium]MCX7956674.1 hypothetical protein [Endomicrobiia bacterium]